jgi:hypothetical protein
MKTLRRNLSYSNVAATLALVFAMSGGALAASRYVINSPKQINPKVLKALKGKTGKTGPAGRQGQSGTPGAMGAQGSAGATGPSDVYVAGVGFGGALTGTYAAYGEVTVPPGSYLIEAKTTLFSTSTGAVVCFLGPGASGKAELDAAAANPETGKPTVLSLIGVQTFPTTQAVALNCKVNSGEGSVDNARVVAIKTESLHGSLPVD